MKANLKVILMFLGVLAFAACGEHATRVAQNSGLTPADISLLKAASAIPPAQRLVARDAGIALSAGGYTLSWKYENPGDYGQDGKVAIEDITPLAQQFNGDVPAYDLTLRNTIQAVIDGSGNGKLGIEDVTPLAMNWASEVTGYRIDGANETNGPWNEVASLTLDDGDASGGRLAFSQEFAPGYTYYRVVTLTPEGDAAFSDTLIAPSNEPIIYGVTPLSGYQHEEYTISATASGQEPLTYAWDFGGGATPNTSSEISPTVTLSGVGEYSCILTISNSYGPMTYLFTLTVSARDMWAHTWGTTGSNVGLDLVQDSATNLYVAATGGAAQVLKVNGQGSLIWARSWTGDEGASAGNVAFGKNGDLIVSGGTRSFGEGNGDFLLLNYSADGELLKAMTWGTIDYEYKLDMDLDDAGNIYLCGSWSVYGGYPLALVVKLDADWNVLWAKRWGGNGWDSAQGILAHGDAVYVCGETGSFSGSKDAFLLKMSPEGEVIWVRIWVTGLDDSFGSLAIGPDGSLYAVGNSKIPNIENVGDILKYSPNGELLAARSWGIDRLDYFTDVLLSGNGKVLVAGYSSDGVIVINYSQDLAFLNAEGWFSEHWPESSAMIRDTEGYTYIAGRSWNASGEWTSIANEEVASEGIGSEVEGDVWDLEGVTHEPVGIQAIPEGILDTGGGGDDVLVLKRYLP